MSNIPNELKYAPSHEWVRDEGNGVFTVGISEHAQDLLGDMVFVELPDVGDVVAQGDDVAVAESVKAASDIYAPVSGEIVAVNDALNDSPELVNNNKPSVFKSKRPTDCHLPWYRRGKRRNTVGRFCGSSVVTTSPAGL